MQLPCDQGDRELFNASTIVSLGDGKKASFWDSSWTDAGTLKTEFPELYKHSKRKNRTVHEALHDGTWVADLAHGQTQQLWPEVIRLNRWIISKNISLSDQQQDTIKWKHTASGFFSTSSAYNCQFQGMLRTSFRTMLWKVWAPARLKFTVWLLLKNRLWCNDRLQRRGWPNEYFCQLCLRNLETSQHLFWHCPFSSTIW